MSRIWTDEVDNRLIQLREQGLTQEETAERLSEEFGYNFTRNAVKNRESRILLTQQEEIDIPLDSSEEIKENGEIVSQRILPLTVEQKRNPYSLMKAHGFNPEEWTLINAKNNIWNTNDKVHGIQELYSSRIIVKPRQEKFNESTLLRIIDRIETKQIRKNKSEPVKDAPYINIPLFDMHFGISDYEYYKPTQSKILGFLEKPRKDILFIIGQDLFHNDDMRGRTASGREIQKVDMEKAFEDAWMFYVPLIEKAIENSQKVHVFYSIGNHDEFSGWSFVKTLEKRYGDQATFDTRFKERKVHMLGKNFIGMNHSDKKNIKRLPENFATEFPLEWSGATTREVFVGHEHAEKEIELVSDTGGIVLRRMPTRNKIDDWHDSLGYTTAHKRFQIFFYNETEVIGSVYV